MTVNHKFIPKAVAKLKPTFQQLSLQKRDHTDFNVYSEKEEVALTKGYSY